MVMKRRNIKRTKATQVERHRKVVKRDITKGQFLALLAKVVKPMKQDDKSIKANDDVDIKEIGDGVV